MSKSFAGWIGAAAMALGAANGAGAAILGPHAAACTGSGPAMLVHVTGFKTRAGMLRVQSYGGDPRHFFDKGAYLERVEVRPPSAGPVEICLPVPRSGAYAVSVRHDVGGDGKSSLADGGGMSGNPNLSLMDVVFKRRPSPEQVTVDVRGVKRVPITLYYVHGTSVGPIAAVER